MSSAFAESAVWYFAFGANMNLRVLNARQVRPLSREAARLEGYRLVFGEPGIPLLEPAFASIEPAPGDVVHGVLLNLARDDFARIDSTEGPGYEILNVEVVGRVHGAVTARAFKTRHPVSGRKPSLRYLNLMLRGAYEHELPAEYLHRLEAQPYYYVPGAALVFNSLVRLLGPLQRRGFLVPRRARRYWRR